MPNISLAGGEEIRAQCGLSKQASTSENLVDPTQKCLSFLTDFLIEQSL